MNITHRLLPVLALLPLPEAVQHHLGRRAHPSMRAALASSPHAHPDVINMLASDNDRNTHHNAMRRTTDVELLSHRLDRGTTCCAVNALRNPVTGTEHLESALQSTEAKIVLAAYVNPATPAQARAAIDIDTVNRIVDVGEPIGDTVVRSHEAILTNRTLLSHSAKFKTPLRRAALAMYDLSVSELESLRTVSSSRYLNRHPLKFTKRGAAAMSVEELLSLNSPAADLWLATRPETGPDLARRMMTRKNHHVEPHIIAGLLNRFGCDAVPGDQRFRIAQTRVDSTAWSNPMGAYFNDIVLARTTGSYDDLLTVTATLGEDLGAWDSFISLVPDWNDGLPALAAAARSL